jgi:hypothetical protein
MLTTPGSGYGLAACFAALIMLTGWFRTGAIGPLLLAIALTFALTQLRIHFFIWFAPALALTVAVHATWVRRHARTLGLLAGTLVLAAGGALAVIPSAVRFWLDRAAVAQYLAFAHEGNGPTEYAGLYASVAQHAPEPYAILLGAALLVPVMLGIFVVLYPLTLAAAVKRTGWMPLDGLPIALLAALAGVTLFAPAGPWGDFTEYQHRPFVVLYSAVAIWTAANIVRALPWSHTSRLWAGAGWSSVVLAAAYLSQMGNIDPASPRPAWAKPYYRTPLDFSVLAAARYIGAAAQAGDTVAVGPVEATATLVDRAAQLASLSNVPTYLARPARQAIQDARRGPVARERLAFLHRIETEVDFKVASQALRERGITWYVWLGDAGPPFDPERRHAITFYVRSPVYRLGLPQGTGAASANPANR